MRFSLSYHRIAISLIPSMLVGVLSFGCAEEAETEQVEVKLPSGVNKVQCLALYSDEILREDKVLEATLSARDTGFEFYLVDARGKYRLSLDKRLVVTEANTVYDDGTADPWNLTTYSSYRNPLKVRPDGAFYIYMAVSTRSGCEFSGRLTFEEQADVKLGYKSKTQYWKEEAQKILEPPASGRPTNEPINLCLCRCLR